MTRYMFWEAKNLFLLDISIFWRLEHIDNLQIFENMQIQYTFISKTYCFIIMTIIRDISQNSIIRYIKPLKEFPQSLI